LQQYQGLHGVREGLFVSPHQTEHSTDVQVRVGCSAAMHVQRLLDLEAGLQLLERCAHLVDPPLLAGEVVVGDGLALQVGLC